MRGRLGKPPGDWVGRVSAIRGERGDQSLSGTCSTLKQNSLISFSQRSSSLLNYHFVRSHVTASKLVRAKDSQDAGRSRSPGPATREPMTAS
jgi:hypothetical protein